MAQITIDTSEWVRSIGIIACDGRVGTNRDYGSFWVGDASARIECDGPRDPIEVASRLVEPSVCRMIDGLRSLLECHRIDAGTVYHSYTNDGVRMLHDIADAVCPGGWVRCYNGDGAISVDLTGGEASEWRRRLGEYVVYPERDERDRLLRLEPLWADWCRLPPGSDILLPEDVDPAAIAAVLRQTIHRETAVTSEHTLTVSGARCND